MAAQETSVIPYVARGRVALSDTQLDILNRTIAKDLTADEMRLFGEVCRRTGLDPFARQIYAIKRGGRITFQVGIDGFRIKSEETGRYGGMIGPLWCGEDGVWKDEWLTSKPPVAAKVGIRRTDFEQPVWSVARYAAYRVANNSLWDTMPEVMIAKCAEATARRIAFPDALSGLYEPAEMDQAGGVALRQEVEAAAVAEASQPQQAMIAGPDAARIYEQQRVQDREEATAAVTQAPDRWVTLHGRIRGVQLTTKREADALCRQACGKTWEACNTDRDYAAIDAMVTKLEQARDAEAQHEAESLAQSALVTVQDQEVTDGDEDAPIEG